jgi:hypothetical protein
MGGKMAGMPTDNVGYDHRLAAIVQQRIVRLHLCGQRADDIELEILRSVAWSLGLDKRPDIARRLHEIEARSPDHRPKDPAQLAAMVAAELRKRGIWADVAGAPPECIRLPSAIHHKASINGYYRGHVIALYGADFDNKGPLEIANTIQALEAQRAQEWAGDK